MSISMDSLECLLHPSEPGSHADNATAASHPQDTGIIVSQPSAQSGGDEQETSSLGDRTRQSREPDLATSGQNKKFIGPAENKLISDELMADLVCPSLRLSQATSENLHPINVQHKQNSCKVFQVSDMSSATELYEVVHLKHVTASLWT